jgi:tRNA (adenine22-N1)-methyltransferase
MKLGKRLQQIDRMVPVKYDHIWDCCCDHGFLGMHLLARNAAPSIHFVDVVESLMADLASQLLKHHTKQANQANLKSDWKVHCLSAAEISMPQCEHNLVIISGVGGDLLIELVEAILKKHPNQPLDFLLCPVHHNYKVRKALIKNGLGLIDESLVKENKRFYEVIYVSTTASQPLSPAGSVMWDFSRKDDLAYLNQMLAHYRRIQHTENTDLVNETQEIIHAYHHLIKL